LQRGRIQSYIRTNFKIYKGFKSEVGESTLGWPSLGVALAFTDPVLIYTWKSYLGAGYNYPQKGKDNGKLQNHNCKDVDITRYV